MDIGFSTNEQRFFNNFSNYFDDDVLKAFLSLTDYGVMYSQTEQDGNNIRVPVDNCSSHEGVLVFKNCQLPQDPENCYFDFSGSTFTRNEDVFVIPALAENCETDECTPVTFKFTDAVVETTVYDATESTILITEPWSALSHWGTNIIEKNEVSSSLLNEKEKELLPILKEIDYIQSPGFYTENPGPLNFPKLKSLAQKYNAEKLITLLEKLESKKEKNKRALLLSDTVSAEMNKKCYEPMWREIYNKFVDSQKEYPKKTNTGFPEKDLKEIRTKVQNLMHTNGYKGTYPDFYKTTDLKSLRSANSHGEIFTIFREKDVCLYIKCIEEIFCDGNILIQFLTGTALNKKDNDTVDVFSCLFNNRGKLFNNCVTWDNQDDDYKSIEKTVFIALKKAELKKLTKEEQEKTKTENLVSIPLYLGMGLTFGILFTLLFAIFVFFFVLLIDGSASAIDIIKTAPWGYCFLASGGLFGLVMFIISLFTNRK